MTQPSAGRPAASGSPLLRNFLNVGGLTLMSRLLGFVRDMMMAALLGTGPAADAFFAAFRFPNLFRRLFAEGAFNTAFVPLFTGALEQHGHDHARDLAARIISWLSVVLIAITILAEIFMPQVLLPFVPGFADDKEKFDLTVLLTRICFPYLAFMSWMAAYAAVLNGLGRFTAAAAAPILLNVVMIVFFVPLIIWVPSQPAETAIWVAVSALAGGIVQLALVYGAIHRAGFVPRFRMPKVDAEVRRFWFLAIPAVITGGITQINIFIGTIIASTAASAISYLYYADRLYQLPLGIIGIAVGTVLLPELSRHLKGHRLTQARRAQDQALLISMLLSMPAAAALVALSFPIVEVLFERGAFDAVAASATSDALIAFAVGLPAFVLIRVLQPGFFAREDTLTPTWFAAISVVVNISLSLLLFPSLQHVGIALATSASAWTNTVLLALTLARRGHFAMTARQWREQALIVLVSLVLGLGLWGGASLAAPLLAPAAGLVVQVLALGVLIVCGLVAYFVLVHVTGIQRLGALLSGLKRS